MIKAFVVIDVQSYFLREAPVSLPAKIADHIKKSDYDLVLFTIFQNVPNSNYEKSLNWSVCNDEEDLKSPTEFSEFITPENVFKKHTYSAFKSAEFADFIKQNKIEKIELCGVDTDACVLATAYEAFDLGLKVSVNADLCFSRAGLDEPMQKLIKRNLEDKNE